jgi:hypothetical protein
MSIIFCNYISQHGFTDDFLKVYDFLKRINQENVTTPNVKKPSSSELGIIFICWIFKL